jgi:histidyl-tRNA synthetase
MSFQLPPGTYDIIPQDNKEPWRSSHLWEYLEQQIRTVTKEFDFQEIRTPLFEREELFTRSVGESTDIVSKEMYTFTDKGKRQMVLRPEGTAPVIRSFVEQNMANEGSVHKLFYIGPMFRYERAQAGRYRQHCQFGAEVIGVQDSRQDAEIIALLYTLITRLEIRNVKVHLNSLGTQECRKQYKAALVAYLSKFNKDLSEESQIRLQKNPLRILDSKHPNDKKIIANAPSILDYLNPESLDHYEQVKLLLADLQIPFVVTPSLVRGLDYYNHTVFEIVAEGLGAQNSIAGGGRYDGLVKQLGGPDLPSLGFGMGMERTLQVMLQQMSPFPVRHYPTLFIIPLGNSAKSYSFRLAHQLRQEGIRTAVDYTGRKLHKAMQTANQSRAQFAIVLGDEELHKQVIQLKEMETGKTYSLPLSSLSRVLRFEQDAAKAAVLWQELSTPFRCEEEKEFFTSRLRGSLTEAEKASDKLKIALEQIHSLISTENPKNKNT